MAPAKHGMRAKKDEDVVKRVEAWKLEIEDLKRLEPDKASLH